MNIPSANDITTFLHLVTMLLITHGIGLPSGVGYLIGYVLYVLFLKGA
jgi:hypothetical protein